MLARIVFPARCAVMSGVSFAGKPGSPAHPVFAGNLPKTVVDRTGKTTQNTRPVAHAQRDAHKPAKPSDYGIISGVRATAA